MSIEGTRVATEVTGTLPWSLPSRIALCVLVALVVVAPWPFGGVSASATFLITTVALVTSLVVALAGIRERGSLAGHALFVAGSPFLILCVLQLLPLPQPLHERLAPGSAHVWHPEPPVAAAVLGDTPRPVSLYPSAGRRSVALLAGLLALAALASPALSRRQDAERAVLVITTAAVVLALYALVARPLFGNRLFGVLTVPTVAPFGPFVSKNHFAGFAEMSCLLVLGLATGWADEARRGPALLTWVESRLAVRVLLAFGSSGVLALSVLASYSRGGVVSLVAGMLVFSLALAYRPGTSRWRLVAAPGLVVLLVVASFLVLPERGQHQLRSLPQAGTEGAGAFRLETWRGALRLFASSPLVGSGLGAFGDAFPRFKSGSGDLRVENAENDYVQTLAETGCVGFICAAGGVLWIFRAFVVDARAQPDRVLRGLGLGAAAGLSALAVHSLFDFNARIPSNALLASFLVALGVARRHRPWGRGPLTAAAVILAVGVAVLWRTAAQNGWSEMDGSGSGLRLTRTEHLLRERLRSRPAHAESWVRLGWVYAARGLAEEAAVLASYGARLDPGRETLQSVARGICGATDVLKNDVPTR